MAGGHEGTRRGLAVTPWNSSAFRRSLLTGVSAATSHDRYKGREPDAPFPERGARVRRVLRRVVGDGIPIGRHAKFLQRFLRSFRCPPPIRRRLRGACPQAEQPLLQVTAVPTHKLASVGRPDRIDLEQHSPVTAVQTSDHCLGTLGFRVDASEFGQGEGDTRRSAYSNKHASKKLHAGRGTVGKQPVAM